MDAPPRPEPPGPAPEAERGKSPLVLRLVAALGWALLGKLLTVGASGLPILSLLALTSVTFVSGAALFGWAGVLAAAAVQLGYMTIDGAELAFTIGSVLAYSVAGALSWLVFRWVPRLERGFERFRTYRWFVAAAAIGGVLTTVVISSFSDSGTVLAQIAVWSRSTIISVWVLAPPLILVARRLVPNWVAQVPGEPAPSSLREVMVEHRILAGTDTSIVDEVHTVPLRSGRILAAGIAACLGLTLLKLLMVAEWGPALFWWNLLYLLPVVWVAQRLRIAGALLVVGVASVFLLTSDASLAPEGRLPASVALGVYGQMLVLWLMGVLVGRGARREGELLLALADSYERIQQDLHRVIRALTGALEAKDEYTEGHLHRVNAYALEVGRRLGLRNRELELLQIGSTLHDIGKIGIPESILQKPAPLDDEEWSIMRRHPEIGARIVAGIEGLADAAPIILHHQERWDGRRDGSFSGYPAGLQGEEIPLGARIIAVVDTFDAMTTDRPYRRALSPDEARAELRRERGRQFDPAVVDRFLEVLSENPWEG